MIRRQAYEWRNVVPASETGNYEIKILASPGVSEAAINGKAYTSAVPYIGNIPARLNKRN